MGDFGIDSSVPESPNFSFTQRPLRETPSLTFINLTLKLFNRIYPLPKLFLGYYKKLMAMYRIFTLLSIIIFPFIAQAQKAPASVKGMVYDTANPDCLFRYHLILKKEYETLRDQQVTYSPYIETLNTPNQPKIYYFSSDNRPEVYNGNAELGTFRNGTMVIDMIDRKSNEVVWRSTATSRKAEADVADLKETVLVALPNMFHKFPVKIKK